MNPDRCYPQMKLKGIGELKEWPTNEAKAIGMRKS